MRKPSRKTICVATGDFDLTESKKGNPTLVVPLKVLEPADRAGETLLYYGTVTDETIEYVTKSLRALGMTNTNIMAPEGLGRCKAQVVEQQSEYKGKLNWRVRFVNELKAKKSLSASAQEDFAARMKAALENSVPVEVDDSNAAPEALPEESGDLSGSSDW